MQSIYIVCIPLIHWKREELLCLVSLIPASKLFLVGGYMYFITDTNKASIKMLLYGRCLLKMKEVFNNSIELSYLIPFAV